MTPDAIKAAAELLVDLRLRRKPALQQLDELPADCRPQSLDEAYAIQDAARAMLADGGAGEPCGWKIGCTTPVMQAYLNIAHPCAGTLYSETVALRETTLVARSFFQLGLECELAVRLGETVPARDRAHDRYSVAPYVQSIMASVEIVDHRFGDLSVVSAPSLIADDFFSSGCVIGAEVPLAGVSDPALLTGGFHINGEPAAQTGGGAAILGHPLTALAWLAEHLLARGAQLKRGEIVTLGSVVKTIYPTAETHVQAVFEGLEPVTLNVA